MRTFCIVVFVFLLRIDQACSLDFESYLVWVSEVENYGNLIQCLDSLESFETKATHYGWHTELQRDIVNDFSELILEVGMSVQDSKNPSISSHYNYKLKLIKNLDQLCFIEVFKDKHIKVEGEWKPAEISLALHQDTGQINRLKSSYKSIYYSEINFKELFATKIVYGSHCGWGGGDPEYRKHLNYCLKDSDAECLIGWLKSATVELQLYAIEGILVLKNQGVAIDPKYLDLIDEVGKKKGYANTCSGCIYWRSPISEVVQMIRKEQGY